MVRLRNRPPLKATLSSDTGFEQCFRGNVFVLTYVIFLEAVVTSEEKYFFVFVFKFSIEVKCWVGEASLDDLLFLAAGLCSPLTCFCKLVNCGKYVCVHICSIVYIV